MDSSSSTELFEPISAASGIDFHGVRFSISSRCKNLIKIDSVSTKVQVGNTRRLSVDRGAFSAKVGRPTFKQLSMAELPKDWSK